MSRGSPNGGSTRRGLLRSLRSPEPPLRRRPPGAIEEREFLARCNGCLDCVTACPQAAVHTLAAHVHPGAGTPVLVPDQRACLMCDGFPCAAACDEGALLMPASSVWPLGKVELDPTQCLPFRGPECGACGDTCPPGAEGALRFERNRPIVDPQLCVGCGQCIEACVVTPAALRLLPV